VAGIAVHWYMDFIVPPSALDITHEKFPDKWIFGSEACEGSIPLLPHVLLGDFGRAESYAKFIIQDLNHWVTGWTDWNMALDENGGPNWANNLVDSAVIVNQTSDEFYKQPMFYIMGHFSKFVLENSVRVEVDLRGNYDRKQVSYVAFDNEELRQTVFILLNE
jgi:glucosylceramidase